MEWMPNVARCWPNEPIRPYQSDIQPARKSDRLPPAFLGFFPEEVTYYDALDASESKVDKRLEQPFWLPQKEFRRPFPNRMPMRPFSWPPLTLDKEVLPSGER